MANTELKQFIKRRRQGQNVRVGVMYAQIIPDGSGEITLGFSLCSKEDQFCPVVAEEMAFDRSLAYMDRAPFKPGGKNLIPDSIKTDMAVFIGRAERFFKGSKLPLWAQQYYSIHKPLVDEFFEKLARKKAAAAAKEDVANG